MVTRDRDGRGRAAPLWGTAVVLTLGIVCVALQAAFTLPYRSPAGHGAQLDGDSILIGAEDRPVPLARPPEPTAPGWTPTLATVAAGSPADATGLRAGDQVRSTASHEHGVRIDFASVRSADPVSQLRAWRQAYWIGLRGPVTLEVTTGLSSRRSVTVSRPAVWSLDESRATSWLARHGGRLAQAFSFLAAALVLLLLRTSDTTARFAVVAFVFCAVANLGSLSGAERVLPRGLREAVTLFSWMALPLAFPAVCFAIAYFPRPTWIVQRYPLAKLLPLAVAAPLLVFSIGTGAFIAGADAFAPIAAWDAGHPRLFFTCFALALLLNVATIVEGWLRFRATRDATERRRIQMAFYTTLPGTLAYALVYGAPAVVYAATGSRQDLPAWVAVPLQVVVLLPAIGVPYAVVVHRVMEPRVVLRRSLQYALARGTLGTVLVLPAALLLVALVRQRHSSLSDIFTGQPLLYLLLVLLLLAGLRYRDRARTWLDRRFFREQYDAKQVLLSLAGRVPYETDPNELTALVLDHIDRALHPAVASVLVSGLEPGLLTPVAVRHGSAEAISASGGLATLLRWSAEPLDVHLDDPRGAARRLPSDEQEWLSCTRSELLVPMFAGTGTDRGLIGALALGPKLSEEPYTAEDRALLSSIAAQMALALDVARLRDRQARATEVESAETMISTARAAFAECPQCGRCDEVSVDTCPADGSRLRLQAGVPRVIDGKYRIDHVLGRGGMGAVYRARDMRLDRDVAVKVVRAELVSDPSARTRFRREAQVVAKLQHPAIVAVFDYGSLPDGGAFIVMELVRGRDLRDTLTERGRLSAPEVLDLMRQLCAGIDAAHAEGVLHRDLKPENIVLSTAGGAPVKVLDFGIAKLVTDQERADTLTMAGTPIGTPAYMAPEQLAGGDVTVRTDIFSLGVVAHELLTGELPFGRGPLLDIAQRQHEDTVGPLLRVHGVPDAAVDVIRRAMAVDPLKRHPSAGALARALDRGLDADAAAGRP